METTCKNCTVALQPDYDYCPKCSQKAHLHRLSMHEVAHEGIHYFTHADKGILKLIRDLALKTGLVAREYIGGKRKKYFPPLNFFLLASALNLFIINFDGMIKVQSIEKIFPNIVTETNPKMIQMYTHSYERYVQGTAFLGAHGNLSAILMLPIVAFVFWLFYRKRGYNFTEHLVANMYASGFTTLTFVAMAAINLLVKMDIYTIFYVWFLFQFGYLAVFYYRMIPNSSVVRAFFSSATALLATFLFIGLGMMIYMMM